MLKYTKEHQWVKVEGGIGIVGITDFAQKQLKDIVFIELPKVGGQLEQFKRAASIESVKSVSDVISPVSGEVIEVNEKLNDNPEILNKDPLGEGWIYKVKLKDKSELDNLLGKEQ